MLLMMMAMMLLPLLMLTMTAWSVFRGGKESSIFFGISLLALDNLCPGEALCFKGL